MQKTYCDLCGGETDPEYLYIENFGDTRKIRVQVPRQLIDTYTGFKVDVCYTCLYNTLSEDHSG